jgi:tryptophanyl-tRNA synthetase
MRKEVLSAIQPTGDMHFGNYFGAVQNWVRLQEDYDCAFGVVDYHAMTMPYDHKKLRNNTWELITNLLAVGIKPENLFVQSLIPEHTELSWILNCFTSYGQLTRMTQFKDKSAKSKTDSGEGFISSGLLSYPVLQAADILLYRPKYVPVGKDQEQHLELTRNIAQRFNNQLNTDYLPIIEALFTPASKIMSTADPERKMSKSAGDKHYISVFADENRIRKQIRSAVTDTGEQADNMMSPGVENLFGLLLASGRKEAHDSLMEDYNNGSLRYADLKEAVADGLVNISQAFVEKKAELNRDKKALKNTIKQASFEIRKIAQETIKNVKELSGLMNVRF